LASASSGGFPPGVDNLPPIPAPEDRCGVYVFIGPHPLY
jgi:hypothetical protein